MTETQLDIGVYLSRLTPAQLAAVPGLCDWFRDAGATRLAFWLLNSGYHPEMSRRWRNDQKDLVPEEPEPLALKPLEWTNGDVSAALKILTASSLTLSNEGLGRLCDDLCRVVVPMACARLERLR